MSGPALSAGSAGSDAALPIGVPGAFQSLLGGEAGAGVPAATAEGGFGGSGLPRPGVSGAAEMVVPPAELSEVPALDEEELVEELVASLMAPAVPVVQTPVPTGEIADPLTSAPAVSGQSAASDAGLPEIAGEGSVDAGAPLPSGAAGLPQAPASGQAAGLRSVAGTDPAGDALPVASVAAVSGTSAGDAPDQEPFATTADAAAASDDTAPDQTTGSGAASREAIVAGDTLADRAPPSTEFDPGVKETALAADPSRGRRWRDGLPLEARAGAARDGADGVVQVPVDPAAAASSRNGAAPTDISQVQAAKPGEAPTAVPAEASGRGVTRGADPAATSAPVSPAAAAVTPGATGAQGASPLDQLAAQADAAGLVSVSARRAPAPDAERPVATATTGASAPSVMGESDLLTADAVTGVEEGGEVASAAPRAATAGGAASATTAQAVDVVSGAETDPVDLAAGPDVAVEDDPQGLKRLGGVQVVPGQVNGGEQAASAPAGPANAVTAAVMEGQVGASGGVFTSVDDAVAGAALATTLDAEAGYDVSLDPYGLTGGLTTQSMTNGESLSTGRASALPQPTQAQSGHVATQVAGAMANSLAKGETKFQMRFDPPELGRVDVSLKVAKDGTVHAHLTVERPETLDMFLRDQRGLERAFQEAGLKADMENLQFSLQDQGGQAFAGNEGGQDQSAPSWSQASGAGGAEEPAAVAEVAARYGARGSSGLDIRI
ncbi:flagellar hook-length control protein FliK [Roseibium aestuarii]|uniref:Flagellar hook-length control protein FliK n=1 Tax=Roseibium aestuarii TaxID=2600299 RepID=A0ABW4JWU1_9HYPH|nr:flagellar hook-length control protein FliK [Roseibium aestuarii]